MGCCRSSNVKLAVLGNAGSFLSATAYMVSHLRRLQRIEFQAGAGLVAEAPRTCVPGTSSGRRRWLESDGIASQGPEQDKMGWQLEWMTV